MVRAIPTLEMLLQDARYGFRGLRKNPGFSLTAILSLALGIGATVAVFSVIYGAVLNGWPYAGFDRVCQITTIDKSGREGSPSLSGPQIRQLRQTQGVESVIAIDYWSLVLTGSDVPEDVKAVSFTGNGFQFFGMPAMLGRYIVSSDAPDGEDPQPVAVLSHSFWRRHFNGDPSIVGKNIQLAHKGYTILGVMPPRFTWMDADVYLPLKMGQDQSALYFPLLKLKPGVRPEAVLAQLQPLFQQFDKEKPHYFPPQFRLGIQKTGESYVRDLRGTLYLLFGAVALLLAIGCGNISILLLARGTARQQEFAVRSALGASRFRIARQLLTEALLLSLLGACLGVILAYGTVGFIVDRLPEYSFPHEADFHVNLPVLFFSVGLAVFSGTLFGVFPALTSARREINEIMQAGTHKLIGSVRGKHAHAGLIAAQIALTLLLLTGAGTAIEGFARMMHRPLGYDPHNVVSIGIPMHENTLTTWAERAAYFAQLRERVAAMPGVGSAAISSNATPPRNGSTQSFEILGKTAAEQQEARTNLVSPEYFVTLRIPLLEGRLWSQSEVMRGATFAIVNETFARRYFPGEDVLGRSLRLPTMTSIPPYVLSSTGSNGWLQIIGVAADAVDDGMDKPVMPAIYLPHTLRMWMYTQILIKTDSEPLAMVHAIRQQIAGLNPDQQVDARVDDLEKWITREPEWARSRLISILFAAFSGLALSLAAVGLYSVVSYTVAQRTNEFGVRMALGALRWDVLRVILLSAAASVGLGLASGVALSLGLRRVLMHLVKSETQNPIVVLGVCLLITVISALACILPAWRGLSVDPMKALRSE